MGLDMYLSAERYLSQYIDGDPEKKEQIKQLFPELVDREFDVNVVTVEVGYWRKANHIHKWFVDNVQDGEDDCDDYHVNRTSLEALRDTCQAVLIDPSRASMLLPTPSGFFFGGTDYDDSYFAHVKNTIAIINEALTLDGRWDLKYRSSW